MAAKSERATRETAGQVRPSARAPLDERNTGATVRTPARNVPAEMLTLLTEIERLQAELKAERAKLIELEATADTDALTGVFNRRGFERELTRALSYIERYWTRAALLYVDLDGFKPVNDKHGHAAGDAMLKAVAGTLARSVRASDAVARLGGDEFGLILWNLSEADAVRKARALEATIADTAIAWGDTMLSVGASIGLAILTPDDNLAGVMEKADRAMYARKAGRKMVPKA